MANVCVGSLYFHTLLGFDGLMKSVGIPASFHDTAGLFVNDLDLVVVDHIFLILVEESVGFQQLADGVDSFGLYCIVLHQLILALGFFVAVGH